MSTTKHEKPLGQKAYGSIGHLPNSRLGPGDHSVNEGMARICFEGDRNNKRRVVWVQEKLDGSCVSVAKLDDGNMVPLGRAGWPAVSSPYVQHRLFHNWAMSNMMRFISLLEPGERVVGEWLAQAHGTRYDLTGREPFVAFDIMRGTKRLTLPEFLRRVNGRTAGLCTPKLLASEPTPIGKALELLGDRGHYGALEQVEGVVYRVETKDRVDFLAKYVRPDKVDGCYLPGLNGVSGGEPVWNWRPV